MPRIIGNGYNEIYRPTPDGKWTHSKANGKSWDTLEEAQTDFHDNSADAGYAVLFLLGFFIILGFMIFV